MKGGGMELSGVRVAIATSDGKKCDQHFARAPLFDIYDFHDDKYVFVERRENRRAGCGCNSEQESNVFLSICNIIKDCRFVVALKVGNGAISYLIDMGILGVQFDGSIENALKQLMQSGRMKALLKREKASSNARKEA